MSCPTCSHTMVRISDAVFHCERCGTVSDVRLTGPPHITVPKLVQRVRAVWAETIIEADHEDNPNHVRARWNRLGIHEAIYNPGERPNAIE